MQLLISNSAEDPAGVLASMVDKRTQATLAEWGTQVSARPMQQGLTLFSQIEAKVASALADMMAMQGQQKGFTRVHVA